MRILNWGGGLLERLGRPPAALCAEDLHRAAARHTGLSDFGADAFRDGLDVLLESTEREAALNTVGRLALGYDCVRLLANRLRVEALVAAHPEIQRAQVRRPLFIMGLPRTGTTLLHNLLAQDPAARAPLLWELLWPAPLEGRGRNGKELEDPRIGRARRRVRQFYRLAPHMRAMHTLDPNRPEECLLLFQHRFASLEFAARTGAPSYFDWLLQHDKREDYAYHRKLLQVLQWQRPGARWVLKLPFHLAGLDALLHVYPDACIVQTHRDPAVAAASGCSLWSGMRQLHCRRHEPEEVGEDWLRTWERAMPHALAVRRRTDAARFFDVRYAELVAEPETVLQRLYDHFGFDRPPAARARQHEWIAAHPQHAHGVHRYALAPYGLSRADVYHRLGDYVTSFEPYFN